MNASTHRSNWVITTGAAPGGRRQRDAARDFLRRLFCAGPPTVGAMDVTRAKTKDPDEWLEATPDFSRPMAPELRESIKWNVLCFSGRKLVCGLSPCKKHLGIVFFRGTELADPAGLFDA